MANKKKMAKKSLSMNERLYKEVSRSSQSKTKKRVGELEQGLDHQLEKTLSLDLEVIFQRRLREDGFV